MEVVSRFNTGQQGSRYDRLLGVQVLVGGRIRTWGRTWPLPRRVTVLLGEAG
jgi:hypothetical protein